MNEAYHNLPVRNLIILDLMYENYKEKKKDIQMKMRGEGKQVLDHFSMNEEDESLYELFDEGDTDDDVTSSKAYADDN